MKTLVLVILCAVVVSARWSVYESTNQAKHDDMDWWESGVFYQIYPKSFKDSDGNGIGDLKGIIEKLGHLKNLGVTGTWLSPIFKSPMKDGGYDIEDFKNVDPMFGTNEDLKELFAKAKELEIKVILDFVPNHTSDKHEWFLSSVRNDTKYSDWYVWRPCPEDPDTPGKRILPNNWISVFAKPAWTYNLDRDACYLHQFTPEQPDLNYRNDEVRAEMIATLKHWLTEGADGFRIDAINHMYEDKDLPNEGYIDEAGDKTSYENLLHNFTMNQPESYEFIYDVRKMMDEFVAASTDKVTKFMMTEAYATVAEQVKWYGKDESTPGSHMPFNFALINNLDIDSKAPKFKEAIDEWMNQMPKFGDPHANWVMGNHDRPRVGYRFGDARHESLAIMTMTLPGINVIYYGEEIRMTNNMDITWEQTEDPAACNTNETVFKDHSRDPVRTPMQWDATANAGFSNTTTGTWLPVHENYTTLNLDVQTKAEKSTFKLYQQLIALRKANHHLHMGDFESRALGDNVFGFRRTMAGDRKSLAVLINLSGTVQKASLKQLIGNVFVDTTEAKIILVNNESKLVAGTNETVDVNEIELGAYDAIVLEVSSATKLTISLMLIVCAFIKLIV